MRGLTRAPTPDPYFFGSSSDGQLRQNISQPSSQHPTPAVPRTRRYVPRTTRCRGVGVRASSRASFGIVCCPGGNHEPRVHEPRVHEPRVQAPPTGGGRWAERGRWGSGGARRWYASGAVTWGHGSLDVTVPFAGWGTRGEGRARSPCGDSARYLAQRHRGNSRRSRQG